MGKRIDSIEEQLSRNPDEISVCQESYDVCLQSETYDIRTEQGVVAFLQDDISPTDAPSTEDQVLLSGLPVETDGGPRTALFDETIIDGLNASTEEYVGTVPDTQPETTNAFTGEFMAIGGSLAIVFAGLASYVINRYERQAKRLEKATNRLSDYHRFAEVGGAQELARKLDINVIKETATWKRDYEGYGNRKLVPLPTKGGKKVRQELRSKVRSLVETQLGYRQAS